MSGARLSLCYERHYYGLLIFYFNHISIHHHLAIWVVYSDVGVVFYKLLLYWDYWRVQHCQQAIQQ